MTRMKLKVYTFSAKGKVMGATVVVAAFTESKARECACEFLKQNNLDESTIRLEDIRDLKSPMILYSCDGDY